MGGNSGRRHIELLLHPVRTRIVAEFAGRHRTVRELAAALPDVPQTSLYRQVGVLVDGGVLEVVDQRSTDGPDERVYGIVDGAGRVPLAEVDRLPPADHLRYFSAFVASLVDALARYMHSEGALPSADGLAYNRVTVHLSESERAAFAERFGQLVGEALAVPPDPSRRRYDIASVVVPAPRSTA